VTATLGTERYRVDLQAGRHLLVADEPVRAGIEIRTTIDRA
jgi:hypothetical protein